MKPKWSHVALWFVCLATTLAIIGALPTVGHGTVQRGTVPHVKRIAPPRIRLHVTEARGWAHAAVAVTATGAVTLYEDRVAVAYSSHVDTSAVWRVRCAGRHRFRAKLTWHGGDTWTPPLYIGRAVPKASWHTALASTFGGPGEVQAVAGPYPDTGTMDARGMFYFAHKTMRFGTRVEFRVGSRTRIGFCADRGPYAGGRVFDLGMPLARALRFGGVGIVKWRVK